MNVRSLDAPVKPVMWSVEQGVRYVPFNLDPPVKPVMWSVEQGVRYVPFNLDPPVKPVMWSVEQGVRYVLFNLVPRLSLSLYPLSPFVVRRKTLVAAGHMTTQNVGDKISFGHEYGFPTPKKSNFALYPHIPSFTGNIEVLN